MVRATWNGATIAASAHTIVIEGNHYFPPDTVDPAHVAINDKRTLCPWKGEASYFDVVAGGQVNAGAAWTYPHPKPAAREIQGYIAFWCGVRVAVDDRTG